jgi:hypothetical protein
VGIVKYGPLVEEVSGTVGGVTFARVKDQKAVRGWRAPTNKRRTLQINRRQDFAASSSRWFETLTTVQRTGWDTYAATRTFTNSLGEDYTISGFNTYVQLNALESLFQDTFVDTAPASSGFPVAQVIELQLVHSTGVLTLEDLDPGVPSSADRAFIFVHNIQRISKAYPDSPRISRVNLTGLDSLPQTIFTYDNPLPGSAGDYQAHIEMRFRDSDKRLSTKIIQMQVSQ